MAAIASTPLITAAEYIARFVDGNEKPACEFVDGQLMQKPMGTKRHSQMQANITTLIRSRYKELNPLPELTARLREAQFYIPDVAVEELAHPIAGKYPGPNDRVLLCVEVVSPPDRVGKLFAKCEHYHQWGVPYCWIIDPERKIAWEYFPTDFEPRKVDETITAGPVSLALADLFSRI
ncbi:MAG: Uma2 family endonuclease [Bryobacteraceae bacterium]